jgi:hypothetical protein
MEVVLGSVDTTLLRTAGRTTEPLNHMHGMPGSEYSSLSHITSPTLTSSIRIYG